MSQLKPVILLVDDYEIDLTYHKQLITKVYSDFQLHTASTGSEALTKIFQQAFDLILMNLRMPEMSGLQAAKMIRNLKVTTPIIGLTHYMLTLELKDKCIQAGMNDVINKPLPDGEKLLERLSLWLEWKYQFDERNLNTH